MNAYSLVPVLALFGLSACGGSGDTTTGGTTSGGSAGMGTGGGSSGGTSSKASGGASSGGASTGGASSGGASSGGASSGGASSGGASSGGSGGGEIVDFACTTDDGMLCIGYHGPSTPVPDMTAQCEMDMGTVGEMCAEGAAGACALTQGGNSITQYYYFTDAEELMSAEMICTLTGGSWSVP